MPRKKKNGHSPARVPAGGPLEDGGSLGHNNTAYGLPQRGFDGATMASQTSSSVRENVVKSMQEMFSHLDPEVIYIVLSECDFKVEHAMDSLLELSVAAEVAAPTSSHVSGFERTAAALLSPCRFAEPRPDPDSNESSSPSTDLTDELDLLVDQELETLTAQHSVKDEHHQYLSVGSSLSSLPPPPLPQQVLPELLQSSLQPEPKGPSGGSQAELTPGASSPVSQLSRWGENVADERRDERQSLVDFSHLIAEADKPPLDLANSGRPSAFQVYKKQEPSHPPPSDQAGLSQPIFGGARSKNVLNQMPLAYMSSPWNPQAAAFTPRVHGNQGPAFITPVAHTTSNWPGRPRQASPWLGRAQAPLKPSATIPKSWALPAAPHPPAQSNRLRLEGRVLVLLRGAPGSGKSTLARALLEHNPGGVALSTDNYFSRHGAYRYDPAALGEAHEWNHKQAIEAFERGANPIIIDNTNMQGWEMKPYVAQALKHGYKVLFKEPDTWWKNKPRELERRTAHNVPVEKIRRMLNFYERYVTVQSIMGSRAPERKPPSPLETSDQACPDLVGLPGVTEGGQRPGPQLCSSLPDVSSIGRSEVGLHEDGAFKSTESLNFQPSGKPPENPATDGADDVDLGQSDAVLDLNRPIGDQRIPDCIVESVVSDEMPVAFSESIAQRVKRERPSSSSASDRLEPADVVKDTKQSDGEAKETDQTKEAERGETVRDEGDRGLEFEGDWPCEASLEQRRSRRREGNAQEEEGASAKPNKTQPGPNVKEFQKLLDLIQTGVADIQVGSHSSSLSQSSREEEEEEGGSRSSSRAELPDCVLDWKDSFRVRESRPENEATVTAGTTDTAVEAGACGDKRGGAEGEAATAPDDRTENSRDTVTEADGSQACPSPVDAESSASQEKKQRQGRRSGKQCKLALTFTQNCPQNTPITAAQSTNNTEPDCDTRLGVKTNSDMSTEPESLPLVDTGRSTQTDPQDFALLWRLNQRENLDDAGDAKILYGDSSRFVPELSSAVSAAVAVDPSGHREVPYHVLHEKGTQVEEKELGAGQDRLEDLRILSRHFKLVSFDTLEDLYEKCHHDLEWTTNLLLDSGERFFRADDEGEKEEEEDGGEALDELHPGVMLLGVEDTQESNFGTVSQSDGSTDHTDVPCFGGANEAPDATSQTSEPSRPPAAEEAQPSDHKAPVEDGARSGSSDDGVIVEESRVEEEMEEEMASMDEANRLLQAELEEMEQKQKREERRSADVDIQSVELKLPTELALQLTELFGPVGVDPASCSTDDYAVQMDLNLAKLLHQKWKESLQEKQRQATLAFHLLQESSAPWGEQGSRSGSRERAQPSRFHGNADGSDAQLPFMDHWNVSRPHVSLRDIIKEEQAMQANVAKTRQSRADLDRRDGAALLKENQLYQLFPGIDRHFLQDIFRDHNYSLTQTELFLRSLLEDEPVKTVVATETPRSDALRAASREREKEKRQKAMESSLPNYQDTEDPEYQDFRAEAGQQRSRQLECFSKAAEAFKQGHKEVASFYAQQGHLHGQRMREANHRAAVQIFQRVNSSLLPRNILDLHGLHVDEALQHLAQVLQDKTTACEQGLCRPQLSVITGRGNHSQGGVARIRPAVIDYLTNKHYRFTEPKPGLVLVSLK